MFDNASETFVGLCYARKAINDGNGHVSQGQEVVGIL